MFGLNFDGAQITTARTMDPSIDWWEATPVPFRMLTENSAW